MKCYELGEGFIDDAVKEMETAPPEEKQEMLKTALAQHIQNEIEDWLEYSMKDILEGLR